MVKVIAAVSSGLILTIQPVVCTNREITSVSPLLVCYTRRSIPVKSVTTASLLLATVAV